MFVANPEEANGIAENVERYERAAERRRATARRLGCLAFPVYVIHLVLAVAAALLVRLELIFRRRG
jgi:hypothetical protein